MKEPYPFLEYSSFFEILVQCKEQPRFAVELAIPAFAGFFERLSQRHRKRVGICFLFLQKDPSVENPIRVALAEHGLEANACFVHAAHESQLANYYYRASIQMLDSDEPVVEEVWQSYSYGLPLICLQSVHTREILDSGCNIVLPYQHPQENIRHIAEMIAMLYFDQEGLKLLKKNAWRRHESYIKWSAERKQGRTSQSSSEYLP